MPTYTYQCKTCNHTFDLFHAMSSRPRVRCAECGKACRRLIGKGSGIIFKGSGFYETDYKQKGMAGAAKSESKGESKSDSKTESKSESKSESKPESKSETKSDAKGSSKPAASTKES